MTQRAKCFNTSNLYTNLIFFASSIMKNIAVFPGQSGFVIKLTCYMAFGSALSASSLIKPIVTIL